jgi:putative PEP-CTERM system TPR-repeat lipoprotein
MLIRKTVFAAILSTVAVPALYITATPALANVQQSLDNPYVASARTHFEAGRTREASIELKNALRQDPTNADARFLLGRILFDQGDMAGAKKELGRAHDLAPTDDSAVWLAETLLQTGDAEAALALVKGDGATIDGTIRRITVEAAALSRLRRFDEAESAYRRSLEIDPRRVEGHFGLAQVFVGRKDFRAAADKLDEIVIGKPDFSPGWMLRGEVALAKGDKQAAFVAFDKAVALSPETAPPLIARARANLASGDLDRAKADTQAVQKLAPNAPIAHYLNSAVAFAEGDIEAANRSFTQLQRNFDNFPPAVLLGALIKHQKDEHNQADSLLVRYIGMQPDNIAARRALASVRLANGQPRNAIEMLDSILKKAPNDTSSMRQMASAHLSLDQYDKAEAIFQRLVQSGGQNEIREAEMALALLNPPADASDPVFADVAVRRTLLKAVDRATNDDAKEAKRLLDQLNINNSATVLALRGSVESQLGNMDRARQYLDRALEMEPELVSAIATYEEVDQRTGKADQILPRLLRLQEARPQSEMLTLGIAQRMGMEGKRAEATRFLSQRAQVVPNSIAVSRALVSAHMVQKEFDAAANEAERLSQVAGQNPGALMFAANALIDADAANRAVPIAKTLRTLVPNSPRGATLLAEAQLQAGAVDSARQTLRSAQKTWPDEISVVSALVKLEVAQRNPDAVKAATKALSRKNPNAAARLTATALGEMGQPGLAVTALESAFAKRPDGRLAVDLFSARRRAGRDDVAFADLAKWIDANDGDRIALMSYATALLEVGRQGEAEKAYETYLALEPNNPVALNNYAWLRHQSQRPDALDYAQRAYDAASGSPEIADTYGWMLVTYGKLKEGLALLQTAKNAAPNNPGIHYHFAYALSKAGRKAEAKSVLVNVLEGSAKFSERTEAEQLMQSLNDG